MQQSAFFQVSLVGRVVQQRAAVPGFTISFDAEAVPEAVKTCLFTFVRAIDRCHCIHHDLKAKAMLAGMVIFSFYGFW